MTRSLEKRIKDLAKLDRLFLISEEAMLELASEMRKDLWDYFRRGLIAEGLTKWFGDDK